MFLYGELSVVISAMAVWMDLKDASVDNGWILFSFMIGFLIQITENGPKGGVIFLAKNKEKKFADTDKKMAECTAKVIGKQMEQ